MESNNRHNNLYRSYNPQFENQYTNEIEDQNMEYQDQMQMMKQKMSLKQAQKLRNCHEILMNLLFSAENYALGKSKSKIFGEYDRYDNTSNKTPLQLKYQFVEQLDMFNSAYNYYSHLYPGKLILPDGLDKKSLLKEISQWKSKFSGKPDEEYYDILIKLIKRKKIRNLDDDLDEIDMEINNEEKKYKGNLTKEEMQVENENGVQDFMNNYAEASHYTDEYSKNINSYYNNKTGEYNFKVKLGGVPGKGFKDFH